jgi:hypothetical protein
MRADNQKLYGGRGADQPCACCGDLVRASDILFEVEMPEHSLLTMQRQCFEAWEIESRERPDARNETHDMQCAF